MIPTGQNLYIVIVGCGRLGALLANRLSGAGHSVVVIDHQESSFQALSGEFSGFKIIGDGTEFAVLKQAKAGNADALIATTREDNVNLMVSQVARQIFGVRTVLARDFDPQRGSIYQEFGIETISPTLLAGEAFLDCLSQSASAAEGEQ